MLFRQSRLLTQGKGHSSLCQPSAGSSPQTCYIDSWSDVSFPNKSVFFFSLMMSEKLSSPYADFLAFLSDIFQDVTDIWLIKVTVLYIACLLHRGAYSRYPNVNHVSFFQTSYSIHVFLSTDWVVVWRSHLIWILFPPRDCASFLGSIKETCIDF